MARGLGGTVGTQLLSFCLKVLKYITAHNMWGYQNGTPILGTTHIHQPFTFLVSCCIASRRLVQGVFLWTLRVCTLGFWVPKPWNITLNKGIWDPKLRGTNIKGTNLKSLTCEGDTGPHHCFTQAPTLRGSHGRLHPDSFALLRAE